MTLAAILVFGLAALAINLPVKGWRPWLMFAASLAAVFALQPAMPVRNLDFWMPVGSLALVALGWALTRLPGSPIERTSLVAGAMMAGVVILVGLNRYTAPLCCLIPTPPPVFGQVLLGSLLAAGLVALAVLAAPSKRLVMAVGAAGLVLLFVVLKTESLSQAASAWLRSMTGQPAALARAADLRWLGFSYIAFRLLHTLRDRQAGRLPALSLLEYANYVIFFPALTAGPIDRVERFNRDLKQAQSSRQENFLAGSERIVLGLFKKFALADTLALVALSDANALQARSGAWLWVLLYAYALRIYFDFSGYTDIALGLGLWMGVKLPENFDRPYLKTNLTTFWNSWHMTLAQWFRFYFFNPLIRALRQTRRPLPTTATILIGQFGTMILIGLWHGVTWNFLIWGAWHGLGLFVHNRWAEFIRSRTAERPLPERAAKPLAVLGWLVTFNYVTLGWVWFALPRLDQSWSVMHRLFGF